MFTYASIHIDIILENLILYIWFFSLWPALEPVGWLRPGQQDRHNRGQAQLWHRLPTLPRHRRPDPPWRWKRSWLASSVLCSFKNGTLKSMAVLPIIDGRSSHPESCWTGWTSPSDAAGRQASRWWSPTRRGRPPQDSRTDQSSFNEIATVAVTIRRAQAKFENWASANGSGSS